ncbi:MAG: RluA family pseudouridine synthase [Candidatus Brocadia sp.]|nr:RluA family pseudouridine synthase [Candidatus Brocadia sp.]
MQKFIVTREDDVHALLHFIARKLTLSKKKAKQLLDERLVFVNKKRVWIASYQLHKGDLIEIITKETEPQKFQKDTILYRDDRYLIVSKPSGIVTNGPESLESNLKTYFKDNHIRAVHRLDKDTTGAVIFAMNKDAFELMKTLFKENLIKKTYRVIVRGSIGKNTFTVDTQINGQKAVTHARLLKRGKVASYLEVNTGTGRMHQIRIHLASLGYPVVGEAEYDRKPIEHPLLRQARRQMLHAYQLSFVHPYTQKIVSITAKIPDDFDQCLKTLSLVE